jgi:transcriptional regulator with XRE-family HTH domain
MTFGKRLKTLRLEKEITQKQLGALTGVAESTISLYEADKRMPDNNMIKAFAEYFGVSTDYLHGLTDVRRSTEIAAASSDVPYDDLPPEAIAELEQYKEFLKQKYGKKK